MIFVRKVVFYGAISLDGYLADKNDDLAWLFDTNTNDNSTYPAFIKEVDTLVMGRITYQETIKLLNGEPFYPDKEVFVFTRDSRNDFENIHFVNENPAIFINTLRKKAGKMIWIVGGGNLLQPLLAANLLDEWWIQIAPVLLGKGKRLFQNGNYFNRLDLIGTTHFGDFIELHYKN